ncbi:MAG: PQQ-like beta-propeller repeat protein [Phycisphaerales bacterium]|nr:MAG: PQQ-like beta-propeller repeat protein [Phycisphaerales bacterium]
MISNKVIALSLLGVLLCGTLTVAADWPQFRGPDRDGKSEEMGLLQEWPAEGPALLWEAEGLGEGYSSAAIAQGAVYITGMIDDEGYVFAFDLDGRPKWKTRYGPEWTKSYQAARCTPTVEDDRLYITSGQGVIYCLDAASGNIRWSLDAAAKYRTKFPRWGMSENVLIDGDQILCTPGGAVASVIALDKNTGNVLWECKELTQQSCYCNPVAFTRGGNRIVATMLADSVVGLDSNTGKLLWRDDFDDYHLDRNRLVNANAPVYHDGCIYTTSGYSNGGAMLQLSVDGTGARRVWTDAVLDVHHGGVVLVDGHLYGSNWRSNSRGDWACLRWDDGQTMYDSKWNGNKGSVIYAEGMLYCWDERAGEVVLVKATPDEFKVTSSFTITKGKGPFWAHPSLADGRLYLRHGQYLMVYDIKAR